MTQPMRQIISDVLAGDASSVKRLISQLTSREPEVQVNAFSVIHSSREPALWAGLLALVADGKWDIDTPHADYYQHVRLTVKIHALFAIDATPEVSDVKEEVLLDGLRSDNVAIRRMSAELLGSRRRSGATDALISALKDNDEEVRRQAAHALGQIGDKASIEPLLGCFSIPEGGLAHFARLALVSMGEPAVEAMTRVLSEPNDYLRWEAVKTLGEIKDPSAIPGLVKALEDDNAGIRWLAADGLGNLGIQVLRPVLEALIHRSGSAWLRLGAHHVLYTLCIGDMRPLISPVLAALDDVEPALAAPIAAMTALKALKDSNRDA